MQLSHAAFEGRNKGCQRDKAVKKVDVDTGDDAGCDIHPSVDAQTHVDAFNTVDAYFAYKLDAAVGPLKNLRLTTQIGKFFDKDPPLYYQDPGYANGSTVGRLIQIGFDKRF